MIRIAQMPGKTRKVDYTTGMTLGQALDKTDLTTSGYEIRLNGNLTRDMGKEITDGDKVVLVEQIKGNSGVIRIAQMPGKTRKVDYEDGLTLGQALDKTDLTTSGYEIRLNGNLTRDMSKELSSGDKIVLVEQIKGNSGNYVELRFQSNTAVIDEEVFVSSNETIENALILAEVDYEDRQVVDKDGDKISLNDKAMFYDEETLFIEEIVEEEEDVVEGTDEEIVEEDVVEEDTVEEDAVKPAYEDENLVVELGKVVTEKDLAEIDIDTALQDAMTQFVDILKAKGIKGYDIEFEIITAKEKFFVRTAKAVKPENECNCK